MKLTGKAKEAFEKWVKSDCPILLEQFYNDIRLIGFDSWFEDFPNSMKFGVYVDFFDSVGIYIDIVVTAYGFEVSIWEKNKSGDCHPLSEAYDFTTRHEARTKAIEKAQQILNERV
jgi:hypothetical protein